MSRRDGHCEITVVDAGPGIPPPAHEQIFERLFWVDAARSRRCPPGDWSSLYRVRGGPNSA